MERSSNDHLINILLDIFLIIIYVIYLKRDYEKLNESKE